MQKVSEYVRKSEPDCILNNKDIIWWNKYSWVIEKLWANSPVIRKCIRKNYANKIRKFFDNGKKKEIRILEIGCGSGWVGRLVASKKTYIKGIDSSSEQIVLAKLNVDKDKVPGKYNYEVGDIINYFDNNEYDGILIHSLLYILTSFELEIFFKSISKYKSGTKIFIHDGVFLNPILINSFKKKIHYRCYMYYKKFINGYLNYVKKKIIKNGTINKKLIDEFDAMNKEGELNGYFLSPKGHPFDEDELMFYINKYFHINNSFSVNYLDLMIAQQLMFHGIESPNWFYKKILTIATILDNIGFRLNFHRYRSPYMYSFMCYELTIK